jgi:pimeloyl-ACP methyl ester carboxylesterase
MPNNAMKSLAILTAVTSCLLLVIFGCTGITSSRARMRVMTRLYFDPESGKYPSLDNNIFGIKTRLTGILNPRKFADIFGFWIFLAEPHRPKRMPVLLVHGHWTGPPAFQKLADGLDQERFEPWYTYYPTGLSLSENASMLRINLSRLCEYYQQDEVAVVAFSMGGLVVRQALKPADDRVRMPKIPLLIGIANPWGGSIKTRPGTRFSFSGKKGSRLAMAESWDEFVDQTPFITALFEDPLPKETAFHMIYGVGGDDDFLEGRDDGALPESSLGRKEAVAEARSVTVFEDLLHGNIIYSDKTIAKVNELLQSI